MRLLKRINKCKKEGLLIAQFLLAITLTGCSRTVVQTVKIDSFCDGKYESIYTQRLDKKDFDNITKIRQTEDYRITIDKFIDHTTIHEKEYEQCHKDNTQEGKGK